jgi:hypothetical protein
LICLVLGLEEGFLGLTTGACSHSVVVEIASQAHRRLRRGHGLRAAALFAHWPSVRRKTSTGSVSNSLNSMVPDHAPSVHGNHGR